MNFYQIFVQLCGNVNISPSAVAQSLDINKSNVSAWKRNGYNPRGDVLNKIAAYFNVSTDYLLGKEKSSSDIAEEFIKKYGINFGETTLIPILGTVQAGVNVLANENLIGFENVPNKSLCFGETYFFLEVKGDSMAPKILEYDLVLVKQQTSVDSGTIAIVCVDGNEGSVKKVVYGDDWIELHSENPYYPVRRFEGPDVLNVFVIGKVIEIKRKL